MFVYPTYYYLNSYYSDNEVASLTFSKQHNDFIRHFVLTVFFD